MTPGRIDGQVYHTECANAVAHRRGVKVSPIGSGEPYNVIAKVPCGECGEPVPVGTIEDGIIRRNE